MFLQKIPHEIPAFWKYIALFFIASKEKQEAMFSCDKFNESILIFKSCPPKIF